MSAAIQTEGGASYLDDATSRWSHPPSIEALAAQQPAERSNAFSSLPTLYGNPK
jgi:hypothetical protein